MGEYDILILSAKQSDGLETWLRESGYRIPAGRLAGARQLHQAGHEVLRRQGEPQGAGEARLHLPAAAPGGLRVAQVHAADPPGHGQRRRAAGAVHLRADPQGAGGDHQLPHGEAASDVEVPLFVKDEFDKFYGACSPAGARRRTCARSSSSTPGTWAGATPAPPIRCPAEELRELGVFWLDGPTGRRWGGPASQRRRRRTCSSPASTCATTPSTSRRTWSSRRPATARTSRGATSCATPGRATTAARPRRPTAASCRSATEQEAQTLASLTGWDIQKIRGRMNLKASGPAEEDEPWWKTIWKD